VQLPPDGQPILLMADRQTTGGYPRLGHLASADRCKAAQLFPGDEVSFVAVTVEEARRAARAQEAALEVV
jgi:allophanate hydrolase subunit 2